MITYPRMKDQGVIEYVAKSHEFLHIFLLNLFSIFMSRSYKGLMIILLGNFRSLKLW